jgi:tRNA pseudouridine38-40 synthase
MKNVLLTIEYDGSKFSGWQRQPNLRTVQGELERVLEIVCKQKIVLHGTSRTDSGVHAFGQRASFAGDFGIPIDKIPLAANRLLAGARSPFEGDVRIIGAKEVKEGFHPRFDSLGKKYIYKIRKAAETNIMLRNCYYRVDKAIDIGAMEKAAEKLVGEHDFKCFMASGGNVPESTIRTIYRSKFNKESFAERKYIGAADNQSGEIYEYEVVGNGFLYKMVRNIVGTLLDVGLGKISADDIEKIIECKDRQKAGHTAPPWGLYLAEIYFNKEDLFNEN